MSRSTESVRSLSMMVQKVAVEVIEPNSTSRSAAATLLTSYVTPANPSRRRFCATLSQNHGTRLADRLVTRGLPAEEREGGLRHHLLVAQRLLEPCLPRAKRAQLVPPHPETPFGDRSEPRTGQTVSFPDHRNWVAGAEGIREADTAVLDVAPIARTRQAKRFEDIGVHVSYGVTGLKTHAKVLLVVRREGDAIRRYVHIGTGNYNPRTARYYTDFGILSADPDLGADLSDLFNVLTGFGAPTGYRKLLVAPRWMKASFLEKIRREAEHARRGVQGRILAKMNALVDPVVIEALYEASQAGVEIDLIIRGICCLRPGVPGVSERIRVISILGRFLEHSRAFLFRNAGKEECYISSADWMPRNLDRRIEAAVPIEEPKHRAEIRRLLEGMLEDNRQAWELGADGRYTQRTPAPGEPDRGTHRVLVERGR